MKKSLTFGYLLMGFTFTVTQGLLIRELLVAFFGNEMSIGLVLASWLVLEAIGSGLLGRLAGRWGANPASFALLQVLFALFLPLCLYAAYSSRSLVGAIPGEGVGLLPIAWASFLILAPLGLVDGAMFAFGARAYGHLIGSAAPSISRVYVLEALGGLAGGLVFTFLFIPFLVSVQIVLLLSSLNLLAAALILYSDRFRRGVRRTLSAGLLVLVVSALAFLLSPEAGKVQRLALGRQWPGYDLLYSQNSVYGNVALVQREEQYTFFADGIPIVTAPVPDVASVEELVHLPLLFVPRPRRVLVLSGGVGGVIQELAKYPLERIDYAELDPLLIEAVQEFPTPLTASELADPRLNIEYVDGRRLVSQVWRAVLAGGDQPYDLVIVNLPYPSTLQLNRLYTVEFYRMVRDLLSSDGVLVASSPGSLSYMSDQLRHLNLMVFDALQAVFPSIRPVPGDRTLWLASPSGQLLNAPLETLVTRWQERDIGARLVGPDHIRLRLDQRYLDWFWSSMDVALGTPGSGDVLEQESGGIAQPAHAAPATLNRDLHPVGLYHGLAYWNALFSPRLAKVLTLAGGLRLWMLALPLLALALALLLVVRTTGRGRGALVPLAIAATGFTGMTADLIIIFAFQSLYGYVYNWIGLLITAFMAGLALGGWLMARTLPVATILTGAVLPDSRRMRGILLRLELALILFWALLPILLVLVYSQSGPQVVSAFTQVLFFLLNALAGFLVGAQFPVANQIWLQGRHAGERATGVLYATDLAGAALAAVLVSVLFLPLLGMVETCVLAAVLKVGSLLLVAALDRQS
jgi:spermidine synthase